MFTHTMTVAEKSTLANTIAAHMIGTVAQMNEAKGIRDNSVINLLIAARYGTSDVACASDAPLSLCPVCCESVNIDDSYVNDYSHSNPGESPVRIHTTCEGYSH